MDKYNIAVSMLSITQPGVWFGDAEKAKSLSRACNEAMAQAVRDNPGRFGLFCAVPLPDQDGSLKEIEYAYDTLKADGVGLMTSYGDKWPGDTAFVPVFEEQWPITKAFAWLRDRLGACEEQKLRNYMKILGVEYGQLINFQTPGRKQGKTQIEIREVES